MTRQKAIVHVIGGQYQIYDHGKFTVEFTTSRGLMRRVKQLRRENAEYWDLKS